MSDDSKDHAFTAVELSQWQNTIVNGAVVLVVVVLVSY